MDWLTEYFELLLPAAIVLLFVFQRMFVRDQTDEGSPAGSQDEEARRIHEEIRRKIIARQQGRTQEEVASQKPHSSEFFPRRQEPQTNEAERMEQPVRQAQPAVAVRDIQEELRIQRERLRQAREVKAEAVRRTGGRRGSGRDKRSEEVSTVYRGSLRSQLLSDLSRGESMKRAFILKEVVDRPIGLRDRPDVFSNWS